jgi:UDPglucose 6-dehydrogenase
MEALVKLAVVGSGYVGLVTGACFANSGNRVMCVDIDPRKLDMLRRGEVPFFEPGLSEMVQRNFAEERLQFTGDIAEAVRTSEVIFIAVGTPPGPDGRADLSAVFAVAEGIGRFINGYKVVVSKSTVPVGTSDKVAAIISGLSDQPFDVVSNPEFLKEGAALDDFLKPDRVVVGAYSERAFKVMRALYDPFLRTGSPLIEMDVRSSEMTKYVSNCMLATRISFMNEMAGIAERVGADIHKVRHAVGADRRIGSAFLFPGVGFGGSCFPKDLEALAATAREVGYDARVLNAVIETNKVQANVLFPKIMKHFGGRIEGRTFAIWGLAFKPQTDDMREAPSIKIITKLLDMGARVRVYDPVALNNAREVFVDRVEYTKRNYDALDGADALVIVTEWSAFRTPDFKYIRELMKAPVVFDGRNLYDPQRMKEEGFSYHCVGRPTLE